MRKIHQTSTVEVYVDGCWHQCNMSQIDEGDIFRIRNTDGLLHNLGQTWMCTAIPNIPCRPYEVEEQEG